MAGPRVRLGGNIESDPRHPEQQVSNPRHTFEQDAQLIKKPAWEAIGEYGKQFELRRASHVLVALDSHSP